MGDSTNTKKVSVITYNTLGTPFFAPDITKRYKKIAEQINNGDYDIVCLQELFTFYHVRLFKKILTNYKTVIYQRNLLGPRAGLVIFSKIPLNDQQFVTYSYPKGAHIPLYTRIAQRGMLSATIDGYGVRICTTHLTSDTEHNLTPKNRLYKLIRSQLHETAAVFNLYVAKEKSAVLVGDFNIAKRSSLYHEFIKQISAIDVFAKDKGYTYDPERIKYFYRAKQDTCDFIFVKGKTINPKTTKKLFVENIMISDSKKSYLSDHIGLLCTLAVNK